MTFEEILAAYTPLTLTESINSIRTDEPFFLTERLGSNVVNMTDETCVFEVEEGSYKLAPVGYTNDPPAHVNIASKITPYAVTPPQIFLTDTITASEVNKIRAAAQNPINMTLQDKGSAYNQLIARKQQGLLRLIDRRVEWFFAQALNGKIDYKSETGRVFKHDYKLPNLVGIDNEYWNLPNDPGNPLFHLRKLGKHFRMINNQLSPDLVVLGGAAADAFLNNPHIEAWLKSPGAQLFQMSAPLARGELQPLGRLRNMEIYEYGATYENDKGKAVPYIDEDCVYLTNTKLWRLFYGAINDFDAGNPPIVARSLFSKMKIDQYGKSMTMFAESHPLPVLINNLGVIKAKVVE